MLLVKSNLHKYLRYFFFSKYIFGSLPWLYQIKILFLNSNQKESSQSLLLFLLLLQVCFKVNFIKIPRLFFTHKRFLSFQIFLKKEGLIFFLMWLIYYCLPLAESVGFRLKRCISGNLLFTISSSFLKFPIIYELESIFEALYLSFCFWKFKLDLYLATSKLLSFSEYISFCHFLKLPYFL